MKNSAVVFCVALSLTLGGCQSVQERSSTSKPIDGKEPLYMKLTDGDVKLADRAVQQALEKNISLTPLSWSNPQTGNQGVIVPIRTYRSEFGTYCRNYKETVIVGRKREIYSDTACRDPRGFWNPI